NSLSAATTASHGWRGSTWPCPSANDVAGTIISDLSVRLAFRTLDQRAHRGIDGDAHDSLLPIDPTPALEPLALARGRGGRARVHADQRLEHAADRHRADRRGARGGWAAWRVPRDVGPELEPSPEHAAAGEQECADQRGEHRLHAD